MINRREHREYAERKIFSVLCEKLSVLCGKKITLMEKQKYITPRIEWIPLDNEISLALESNPPIGPGETLNSIQSPFKEETGLV